MHQPSDRHPPGESEHDHHQCGARLPQRREQEQEYDPGKRQREIGEAEQQHTGPPPPEARDGAHRDADRDGHEHRQRADGQRDPRAEDQPGPHVPPEAIRAEQMELAVQVRAEGGQKAGGDDVPLEQRVSGDERCQHRHDGRECQDRQTECRPAVPKQAATRRSHRAESLKRGSAQAVRSSASRFPSTTSTALTAVAAMTTG